MDTILVVNAGSSSVKFEVFAVHSSTGNIERRIKGQMDGIGAKPRLRASGFDRKTLVDQSFTAEEISDVATALHTAGAWMLEPEPWSDPHGAQTTG